MKKMISLILAMLLFAMPCLAESGVIGGADGLTAILIGEEMITGESIYADAIAAGRRVTVDVSVPEISGVDTGDASVDTAIVDFVKALGLRVVSQGDEYDVGLSLSDKDVLTMGWAVSGEDVYLKSNLIGGTIVLSEPEIEPIISRLLDMMVLMEAMTEEEAAEIKAQLPNVIEQYKSQFAQELGATLTLDDLLAMDYSAFSKVYMDLLIDLEEVEDVTVPRMCDVATHGVTLSIDNDEFVAILRAFFQFIKDNPKLMDNVAAQGAYPTEESRKADWELNGELYKAFDYYASEEEYIAENPTFNEALDQAMAELDTLKMLDGEFITTVYFNDAEEVVYLTSVLPMFTETESVIETEGNTDEVNGVTEILNVVYTRQTVAEGVSHVCNIDVDGEGVTIDLLAKENAWTARLISSVDQEMVVTINVVNDNGTVKGDFTTNDEIGVAGTFSWFHVADENQFKTAIAFEMHSVEAYLAAHPNENGHALSIDYTCDYDRNGVDFIGKEVVTVGFDDVKVVVDIDIATSEPTDSIMSGEVVRPAELDDAAFANWFVSAYNAVNSWVGNAMMALPESVLTLLISSSMTTY